MVKKKTRIKEEKLVIPSALSEDQPANKKIVWMVRDELQSEIRSLDRKMDARFNSVEARFTEIDARFSEMNARFPEIEARFQKVDARFTEIDARFDSIESKLEAMDSKINRMAVLLEDQNSNNRIVLEGLRTLWERQDRIESRL